MRGTIRNNTSQFQRFTPGILQDHCDALGSVRRVTNENGSGTWMTRYYPFGEMFTQAGTGNTHTFTGKEWDSEMSLNYFCQRYYDPEIGRFMTLDPLMGYLELPQSQNRYAYCVNNPLKYIDPLGLNWIYSGQATDPQTGQTWGVYVGDPTFLGYYDYESWMWENFGNWGILGPEYGPDIGPLQPIEGNVINNKLYPYRKVHRPNRKLKNPAPPNAIDVKVPVFNPPEFAVGWQWQAGYTLNRGFAVGLNQMLTPNTIEGLYSFGESNMGGACGTNAGIVLAWGSGSWSGFFADLSVSYSYLNFTYFESGSWKGVFIGLGIGPPIQVTGGGAEYFKIPD